MQSVWQCTARSANFRSVAKLIQRPMPELKPEELRVKNRYLGVNASDVNWTAGRYDPSMVPPFDLGFEALGEVVAKGKNVSDKIKVGQPVAYMKNGAASDTTDVSARHAFPVPSFDPGYLPLLVSGLTASIALREAGRIGEDERRTQPKSVLVTAAAGGTGQFAVQIAKAAGCHVVGTTSSQEKGEFLRSIGCDRVVNYKTESLSSVLKAEYPSGMDVVYESVGGKMFDDALASLAVRGRLIVIGFMQDYKEEGIGFTPNKGLALLPPKLLKKSASVNGFFLFHYLDEIPAHFARLATAYAKGQLVSRVDVSHKFLDSLPDAVEFLHSGQSLGKVVVQL